MKSLSPVLSRTSYQNSDMNTLSNTSSSVKKAGTGRSRRRGTANQKDKSGVTAQSFWTDEFVNRQRSRLERQGWIYLSNLPNNFLWIGYVQYLTCSRLIPQDDGQPVYDVKSLPGHDRFSDSKSQNSLRPHTEASYLPEPPQFLALHCIQPSRGGDGHTLLADVSEFLLTLTENEQQQLSKALCPFTSKDGTCKTIAPILDFPQFGRARLRFSFNVILYGTPSPDVGADPTTVDPFLREICDRILAFFEDSHRAIHMESNSLLIVDNWRILHSRTNYTDASRHLQRIWLQ